MHPAGILVVDKPRGMTSRKAADRAGSLAGARKSGHAGTLDPLATGVLVVCMGRATLLTRYLAGGLKEYLVTAEMGLSTDTYDTDGRVLDRRDASGMTREDIETAAAKFIGTKEQVPPPFSAVKHGGKPLHRYARAGIPVEAGPRQVFIEDIEVTSVEHGPGGVKAFLRVSCGPGTYVRSIVSDIGQALGCGACVSELRRTRSGEFHIDDSTTIEAMSSGEVGVSDVLLSMEDATSWMSTVEVNGEGGLSVSQGKPLVDGWISSGLSNDRTLEVFRVVDSAGRLLALYGPPRAGDPEEVRGRAVRVIRPNTLRAEGDEAA